MLRISPYTLHGDISIKSRFIHQKRGFNHQPLGFIV